MRKIRYIYKYQQGGLMGSQNATLTSQAQQAVNNQITQTWLSQNPQNNQNLFSQFSNGLSNLGIMSGNSTLSQLGQFGNTLNSFSPVMQNWSKLSSGQKLQGGAGIGGAVADGLDNMLFSKQHMNDSALTKGLNSAYDTASNTLMMFSPVGTIVGGAMKVGKFLGDGLSALGVGTDQMTTTDQILDSNFMKLTPVGLVNGIGAKKSKDFSINQDTIEKVGSSYGGSVNTINDAKSKAGKKYGLFSSGARKKANALIDKANTQQNIMTDISDTYQDQLANKSDLAYTRYNMNLNGGYQQQYIRAAKQGAILNRINRRKLRKGEEIDNKVSAEETPNWQPTIQLEQETPKFQKGGFINKPSYKDWLKTVSSSRLSNNYDLETAYNTVPFDELEQWRNATDEELDKGLYHLPTVNSTPDKNGNLWFLKLGKLEDNPELKGEFDWYNSDEAKDFRQKYNSAQFDTNTNRYYYSPKTKKFQKGGELNIKVNEWEPVIQLDIPEFKEGGKSIQLDKSEPEIKTNQQNVIPEGALHANKHHMENADDLTNKGIPVVDNKGEQQAEIERNEIIFNLEVTKKLEELNSKFQKEETPQKEKDELAIKAGKLLVNEILHNTIDRTGLIKECKKGGTLNESK